MNKDDDTPDNVLHQIVYCSQQKGRVFRRQIEVSKTGKENRERAMRVTGIEVYEPGDEIAVDREADPDEEVN